ncbi:hypothetical protein ACMFFR_00035 [Pseudomonas aeruginosa]|uniref:hypothetical protein n=1 Tax=Pseudomonas aeruginosa TaxID=287 RepID=UPI003D06F8CE
MARAVDERAANILTACIGDATLVQGADHHWTELTGSDFDVKVQIGSGGEQVIAREWPGAELRYGASFDEYGLFCTELPGCAFHARPLSNPYCRRAAIDWNRR